MPNESSFSPESRREFLKLFPKRLVGAYAVTSTLASIGLESCDPNSPEYREPKANNESLSGFINSLYLDYKKGVSKEEFVDQATEHVAGNNRKGQVDELYYLQEHLKVFGLLCDKLVKYKIIPQNLPPQMTKLFLSRGGIEFLNTCIDVIKKERPSEELKFLSSHFKNKFIDGRFEALTPDSVKLIDGIFLDKFAPMNFDRAPGLLYASLAKEQFAFCEIQSGGDIHIELELIKFATAMLFKEADSLPEVHRKIARNSIIEQSIIATGVMMLRYQQKGKLDPGLFPGNKNDCSTFVYMMISSPFPSIKPEVYFGHPKDQVKSYAQATSGKVIRASEFSFFQDYGTYVLGLDHHMRVLVFDQTEQEWKEIESLLLNSGRVSISNVRRPILSSSRNLLCKLT